MRFASPWLLLLLLPVVALVVAYVLAQRRRQRHALRFAAMPMLSRVASRGPGWRRHVPAALLLVALALLTLAVARPEADVRVPRERATVVVAVDVSLSMQATDVDPSRLEAAQRAAVDFVEGLPDGFGVSVVSFSGQVTVLAPADAERQQAVDALEDLRLAEATAIGEGVFTSLQQVEDAAAEGGGDVPGQVVLLSDGTNTVGRSPSEAARAAVEAGVPVSTIAYGTPLGTVEVEGQLVPVPVDEESLARLAQEARGAAYTAQTGDELEQVYDDISSSIGWTTERREITQWVATAALLLGLLAAGLSLRWGTRLP
ncbi:VWA domain-containing protein [Nocardioides marmoraquaticus]